MVVGEVIPTLAHAPSDHDPDDMAMIEQEIVALRSQFTELKERLEALVQSKDQFVATVSHELRTPLTAIFGLSQELRREQGAFTQNEVDEFIGLIAEPVFLSATVRTRPM